VFPEAEVAKAIPECVTLVGTGVIGRGWIRVFAEAGAEVRLYDQQAAQPPRTLEWLKADLALDESEGLLPEGASKEILGRVSIAADLAVALEGADYVQESAPEKLEVKQAVFRELDAAAAPETLLASSTSALDIGEIAGGLPGERRCVMAHPFNPPHILPVVEMLAAPRTDPEVFEQACRWLEACGQVPVRMKRYVRGFLGNRIQSALIREAMLLVEEGVAEPDAVDAVIRDGLALRWATIGNFGANHSNADGGIEEYFGRYGEAYYSMFADLKTDNPKFDRPTLRKIGKMVETREGVRDVAGLLRRRDVLVKKLRRMRRDMEPKR
jgi:3-hydroxyacyl-CoA dehydrogenase